ncbi:ABC transporter ATP-binding protein, partial [Methanosalsum natronophilum]
LTALCGKRCLILTNGGMVEHAKNRIKNYAETSGIDLNVSILKKNSEIMRENLGDTKLNVIT